MSKEFGNYLPDNLRFLSCFKKGSLLVDLYLQITLMSHLGYTEEFGYKRLETLKAVSYA